MRKILLTLLAINYCILAVADTKKADRLFEQWEFYRAAKLYEQELEKTPTSEIYFKLGECYMNMKEYDKAVKSFDHVNEAGAFPIARFYLEYGQMLKISQAYDEARTAFKTYIKLKPTDKRGKYYLESIDKAIEDSKTDLPIVIRNVKAINTKYSEMCPSFYKTGLVYTATSGIDKNNTTDGASGTYYSSLYFAERGATNMDFEKIMPLPGKEVDNKYHDGPGSFSADMDTFYFSRVERRLRGEAKRLLGVETIRIFSVHMKDGKWAGLKGFDWNNDSFSVACPFLSRDRNRLYFASDRKGGYGETDIWYCKRTRIGWGRPINMGPKVNTFGRESYPFEDDNGNLFFASDGYQGFGGLDICVALNERGAWQQAAPMKQPINSTADDFGIAVLDPSGKSAYFTSNRAGGEGSDDIYYYDIGAIETNSSGYTMGNRRDVKRPKQEEPKKDSTIPVVVETKAIPPPPPPPPTPTINLPPKPAEYVPMYNELIINFDVDRSVVREKDYWKIDKIIAFMNKHPEKILLINGHTDTRASEHYNDDLSRRRAIAARDFLLKKGFPLRRMKLAWFGYGQLINFCGKDIACPELQQEENRRVEFKISN